MKIHFEKLCSGDSCGTRPKYEHWFVNEDKYFDDARQYCQETYQGDIIQYDPRLLNKEGRKELADYLGLVGETLLKLGFTFDSFLGNWKRVGDGQEVDIDIGFDYGYPEINNHLYWIFDPAQPDYHHILTNYEDYPYEFICERQLWKLLGWSFPARLFAG